MKKYEVIYCDPPWTDKDRKNIGKGASNKYNTMTKKELFDLPIAKMADENCILLMWVTYPTMKQAFELIENWGFDYKTCAFVWVKRNKIADSFFWGLGQYTRSNTELCLLARKGSLERKSKSVHQVIYEPIDKHSKKPQIVRDKIIELFGDVKRLELFARNETKGWDVFGNEVENSIDISEYYAPIKSGLKY